ELDVNAHAGERQLPEMAAHGYQVRLGDERVAGPVAQAVRGMRPGERREVEIELPEDHPDRKLRGRDASVDLTLLAVREPDLAPLDDELARRVSEFDSLAELRDDITAVLRAAIDREVEGRYRAAVLDELGRAVEVSLPADLVEERTRELVVSVARAME